MRRGENDDKKNKIFIKPRRKKTPLGQEFLNFTWEINTKKKFKECNFSVL